MPSQFQNDSIFWVDVDKIKPNPYQPRRDFDEERLNDLAESIRQYGVLQPLVVTRREVVKEDGGLGVEYELLAGERRLRASKIAGVSQVPVLIRSGEESDRAKLEIAIIENLQREDLNPIDRASAFERLATEFKFNQTQIARKIGKSREYVSNSLRLLSLPPEVRQALTDGRIAEGQARPLLMLSDRPEEQATLFKEIIFKQLTVREIETITRRIAHEKTRKRVISPEVRDLEARLAESLGTRVHIEQRDVGGKIVIDYFSSDDLRQILALVHSNRARSPHELLDAYIAQAAAIVASPAADQVAAEDAERRNYVAHISGETGVPADEAPPNDGAPASEVAPAIPGVGADDVSGDDPSADARDTSAGETQVGNQPRVETAARAPEDELYSVKHFNV